MIITQAQHRPEGLIGCLLLVWESSVRTTHDFLSEQDIVMLRPAVADALRHVPKLFLAAENEHPIAFLGMDGEHVEMLFVDAQFQRQGTGGALLRKALAQGARRVDVNEQNPQALAFYLHMGFAVTGRSATDSLGLPFPILHLTIA